MKTLSLLCFVVLLLSNPFLSLGQTDVPPKYQEIKISDIHDLALISSGIITFSVGKIEYRLTFSDKPGESPLLQAAAMLSEMRHATSISATIYADEKADHISVALWTLHYK